MKKVQLLTSGAILCVTSTIFACSSGMAITGSSPQVEPTANDLLESMGEFLGSLDQFEFTAQIKYDAEIESDQMVEYGGTLEVAAARPDRLRSDFVGDERTSRLAYDGSTVTIWSAELNAYATSEAPDTIGDAIDMIFDQYGYSVPAADFVYPNPYEVLIEYVETGSYIGLHEIDGVSCHHLAFTQSIIDWQIWIEDGPNPVPHRLLIIYKDEPGMPRYEATLNWDLSSPPFADGFFEFVPPEGSTEMDFLSSSTEENDQ